MIKYLVMDVDGTLTDGRIYLGPYGEAIKAFSVKDGCGIKDIAIPAGIVPVILTGRESDIVLRRCKELGITEVHQGVSDKLSMLDGIRTEWDKVAYMGDDLNDLSCMHAIKAHGGVVGCPKDAAQEVIKLADFVSKYNGGKGAVREFIEWIIKEF